MDFLRDLGLMAAGYAISGLSESNAVADLVDSLETSRSRRSSTSGRTTTTSICATTPFTANSSGLLKNTEIRM